MAKNDNQPPAYDSSLSAVVRGLCNEIEMTWQYENALKGFSEALSERFNIPVDEARAQITTGFQSQYEQSPGDMINQLKGRNPDLVPWDDPQSAKDYKQDGMRRMQAVEETPGERALRHAKELGQQSQARNKSGQDRDEGQER